MALPPAASADTTFTGRWIGNVLSYHYGCGRLQGLRTVTYQRFCWSEPVWSPPPESNRRPHPYHGTTRNRCADRRYRRSRPTVRAEVIGSLPAKLCAHFQDMGRSSAGVVAAQVEAPVHHPLDAAAGSWNTAATARVAPATTRLKSWPTTWPGRRTTLP